MTTMVSLPQSHQLLAVLGTNANWDEVSSDVTQRIIENPKGSGREFTRFVQNGGRATVVSIEGLIPPIGGRIHVLSIPVDEARPWDAAIDAAGPDTGKDWDVRKVGDLYPAAVTVGIREVILVNFGPGSVTSSADVLAWGRSQKLRSASPRTVFAIGEHRPTLDKTLGMQGAMAVVALEECSFGGGQHVCFVWWDGAKRGADLDWFAGGWDGGCWFAFVRESR